eukprot:1513003-Pleurochrysis_carterae.AAC.1
MPGAPCWLKIGARGLLDKTVHSCSPTAGRRDNPLALAHPRHALGQMHADLWKLALPLACRMLRSGAAASQLHRLASLNVVATCTSNAI